MRKYKLLAYGPARTFEITVGKSPGYGLFSRVSMVLDEIVRLHHRWQEERGLVFGVRVSSALVSYGIPEEVDGEKKIRGHEEPVAIVSGDFSPLYEPEITDQKAFERVVDLADFLAAGLYQERVYIRFRPSTGEETIVIREVEYEEEETSSSEGGATCDE